MTLQDHLARRINGPSFLEEVKWTLVHIATVGALFTYLWFPPKVCFGWLVGALCAYVNTLATEAQAKALIEGTLAAQKNPQMPPPGAGVAGAWVLKMALLLGIPASLAALGLVDVVALGIGLTLFVPALFFVLGVAMFSWLLGATVHSP